MIVLHILARVSVSERSTQVNETGRQAEEVTDGAGQWIIKNGKFYDPVRRMYIIKCKTCKILHYHARPDAITCSDACRMKRSRTNQESDFRSSTVLYAKKL